MNNPNQQNPGQQQGGGQGKPGQQQGGGSQKPGQQQQQPGQGGRSRSPANRAVSVKILFEDCPRRKSGAFSFC